MIDQNINEGEGSGAETNRAIADALREHGGLDLLCAGVARLLEADAKNHDMLAAGEMRWRGLCERVVAHVDRYDEWVKSADDAHSDDLWTEGRGVITDIRAALGHSATDYPFHGFLEHHL
jgi:hypothetical protein